MDREILRKMLVVEEGLRLRLYRDIKGLNTIGVGRNLDANGISEKEAMFMLENDISDVEEQLDHEMPWWRQLDEVRQLVLADMCFNIGIHGLSLFKQTLACIKSGRYEDAAQRMARTPWAEQVGSRAVKLVEMMRSGRNP